MPLWNAIPRWKLNFIKIWHYYRLRKSSSPPFLPEAFRLIKCFSFSFEMVTFGFSMGFALRDTDFPGIISPAFGSFLFLFFFFFELSVFWMTSSDWTLEGVTFLTSGRGRLLETQIFLQKWHLTCSSLLTCSPFAQSLFLFFFDSIWILALVTSIWEKQNWQKSGLPWSIFSACNSLAA